VNRKGIILAGVAVLDIVNIIDHWPQEETLSFIDRTEYAAGGPPHNAAAGLKKLGAPFPVTFICVTGDDLNGKLLLESARGYGLDTSACVVVPGATTTYTQVMSCADTGRRTFFAQLGVAKQLTVEQLRPRDASAKLYYIGSPGLSESLDSSGGWQALLAEARDMGLKTCIELCPAPPALLRKHVTPCLSLCDYFVVNDYEAESVTGIAVTRDGRLDWSAAERACRALLDLGVGELAGIHHPDGAVAVTRLGEVARRGSVRVPAEHIAGTTGAGDAFFAGLLFGVHEDWPLDKCVDLGNAAAATSLRSPTTSASIRPWTECLAYAAQHGLRPVG
jgi:sugar/nucleoside kinase (ribokinase family)